MPGEVRSHTLLAQEGSQSPHPAPVGGDRAPGWGQGRAGPQHPPQNQASSQDTGQRVEGGQAQARPVRKGCAVTSWSRGAAEEGVAGMGAPGIALVSGGHCELGLGRARLGKALPATEGSGTSPGAQIALWICCCLWTSPCGKQGLGGSRSLGGLSRRSQQGWGCPLGGDTAAKQAAIGEGSILGWMEGQRELGTEPAYRSGTSQAAPGGRPEVGLPDSGCAGYWVD